MIRKQLKSIIWLACGSSHVRRSDDRLQCHEHHENQFLDWGFRSRVAGDSLAGDIRDGEKSLGCVIETTGGNRNGRHSDELISYAKELQSNGLRASHAKARSTDVLSMSGGRQKKIEKLSLETNSRTNYRPRRVLQIEFPFGS